MNNVGMEMNRDRDRSPLNNDDNGRDRDQDRSRRGDRPSRFGPRSSSPNRSGRKRLTGTDCRIFVSNIPYEYRWQELKDLFRKEIGEVSFVQLFTSEEGKPRGCGIVEFELPESVQMAIDKLHRRDLNGRQLVVKEDFDTERDKCGRPVKSGMGGGGGGGGMGGGGGGGRMRDEPQRNISSLIASLNNQPQADNSPSGWGNTYGLSPQFLEGLNINGPLITRVFVANLDYKVDEKKLKEVFKMAGRVVKAELHLDRDGKSRGFGVVEYEHPVEAVQAISLFSNQMLYDRKMTVRMDRVDRGPDGPPKLPEGLGGIGMGLGSNGLPLLDVARRKYYEEMILARDDAVKSAEESDESDNQAVDQVEGVVEQADGLIKSNDQAADQVEEVAEQADGLIKMEQKGQNGNLPSLATVGQTTVAVPTGINQSSLGLGNPVGLSGLTGLGSDLGSMISSNRLNVGHSLLGTSSLMGGNNSLMGGNNSLMGGNNSLMGGNNSLMGGNNSLMGGGNSSLLGNSGSLLGPNNSLLGNSYQQNFESLSAVLGSGYSNGGSGDREMRGNQGGGGGNNASRGGAGMGQNVGGGGGGGGNRIASDTVIVKNLAPTFTWQALRDTFRSIGEVKYAEMRAKDVGIVRFSSEREADRAVHMMDRKRVEGRPIEVALF